MNNQEAGPTLALYMTSGCRLCEQAEALLAQAGLAFSRVEIADDAILLERYGVRIPVVHRLETGQELDWPIDSAALEVLR